MPKRYIAALAIAGTVFAALFGLLAISIEMARRSWIEALAAAMPIVLSLACMNIVLLAVGVGPLIAWMCARSTQRCWWRAALLGAGNGGVYVLVSWLMFAERDETILAMVRFWARVPGELLMHLVPSAAAGLAFGAWLGSGRRIAG